MLRHRKAARHRVLLKLKGESQNACDDSPHDAWTDQMCLYNCKHDMNTVLPVLRFELVIMCKDFSLGQFTVKCH